MLNTTQAGFCKQKDPIHQLENVIMALEDAKLISQRHLCPYCGLYLSFQYH